MTVLMSRPSIPVGTCVLTSSSIDNLGNLSLVPLNFSPTSCNYICCHWRHSRVDGASSRYRRVLSCNFAETTRRRERSVVGWCHRS